MLNIGLGLIRQVCDIAKRAGDEVMTIYATDFDVASKDDKSPVTAADTAAETVILRSIREGITDSFPLVSEEAASAGQAPTLEPNKPFWLIDPLDGTKEFISRNGEFTVNIALMENNKPVLGVVHVPARSVTYWGASVGSFVEEGENPKRQIRCRPAPDDGLIAAVSRSHRTPEVDAYLSAYTIASETSSGSSVKFCTVADGLADIYPRLGRTMEWDTAAGHAVLRFAGGVVKSLDGSDLTYGKPGFENPHFVAAGPDIIKSP